MIFLKFSIYLLRNGIIRINFTKMKISLDRFHPNLKFFDPNKINERFGLVR